MEHQLAETYLKRLRGFEASNPAAYQFLKRLEQEGPAHGLWLSAGSGVHVYKRKAFLAHVQLSQSKARPSSLLIAKHDVIWKEAYDMSHLVLAHPLVRLVMASSGFRKGWATARGFTVELKANTPCEFFDVLFGTLCILQVEEETSSGVFSEEAASAV